MANEKRLIDANELAKEYQFTEEYTSPLTPWTITDILNILDEAPTVDAVEVVHGRWLNWRGEPIMPDDYWRLWRCSVCNNEWEYPKAVDADEVSFHYCPNCGAKMDGDVNGTA